MFYYIPPESQHCGDDCEGPLVCRREPKIVSASRRPRGNPAPYVPCPEEDYDCGSDCGGTPYTSDYESDSGSGSDDGGGDEEDYDERPGCAPGRLSTYGSTFDHDDFRNRVGEPMVRTGTMEESYTGRIIETFASDDWPEPSANYMESFEDLCEANPELRRLNGGIDDLVMAQKKEERIADRLPPGIGDRIEDHVNPLSEAARANAVREEAERRVRRDTYFFRTKEVPLDAETVPAWEMPFGRRGFVEWWRPDMRPRELTGREQILQQELRDNGGQLGRPGNPVPVGGERLPEVGSEADEHLRRAPGAGRKRRNKHPEVSQRRLRHGLAQIPDSFAENLRDDGPPENPRRRLGRAKVRLEDAVTGSLTADLDVELPRARRPDPRVARSLRGMNQGDPELAVAGGVDLGVAHTASSMVDTRGFREPPRKPDYSADAGRQRASTPSVPIAETLPDVRTRGSNRRQRRNPDRLAERPTAYLESRLPTDCHSAEVRPAKAPRGSLARMRLQDQDDEGLGRGMQPSNPIAAQGGEHHAVAPPRRPPRGTRVALVGGELADSDRSRLGNFGPEDSENWGANSVPRGRRGDPRVRSVRSQTADRPADRVNVENPLPIAKTHRNNGEGVEVTAKAIRSAAREASAKDAPLRTAQPPVQVEVHDTGADARRRVDARRPLRDDRADPDYAAGRPDRGGFEMTRREATAGDTSAYRARFTHRGNVDGMAVSSAGAMVDPSEHWGTRDPRFGQKDPGEPVSLRAAASANAEPRDATADLERYGEDLARVNARLQNADRGPTARSRMPLNTRADGHSVPNVNFHSLIKDHDGVSRHEQFAQVRMKAVEDCGNVERGLATPRGVFNEIHQSPEVQDAVLAAAVPERVSRRVREDRAKTDGDLRGSVSDVKSLVGKLTGGGRRPHNLYGNVESILPRLTGSSDRVGAEKRRQLRESVDPMRGVQMVMAFGDDD